MRKKTVVLVFSILGILQVSAHGSSMDGQFAKAYNQWVNQGEMDVDALRDLDREFITEAYARGDVSLKGDDAIAMLWSEFFESVPSDYISKDFIKELASMGSGSPRVRPSMSHSAWIFYVDLLAEEEQGFDEFYRVKVSEKNCPVGYLYALGILANHGEKKAIDRLVEYCEFSDDEGFRCAMIAAQKLMVAAYRDGDEDALYGVKLFNASYETLVLSQ